MDKLICYCFNYRNSDIIKDLIVNEGCSLILQRIVDAKNRGDCQCEIYHPEKR
ncbi:MAG TPA: hypothetical protein VJ974_05985 [Geopsychrobacteraceae bacterium]|nr:hypothetical protein [Geopsychrobacteraceae bacterium]